LKLNRLHCLLLHCQSQFQDKEVRNNLLRLKQEGKIKKIGVSVYSPSELERLNNIDELDIIQLPLNLFDKRFLNSKWISRLHTLGIEVHVRSIFLQGLLLMKYGDIPNYFRKWSKELNHWIQWLYKHNYRSIDVCLAYALSIPEVSKIIVGIDSVDQLKEIIKIQHKLKKIVFPNIVTNDQNLLIPSNWPIK